MSHNTHRIQRGILRRDSPDPTPTAIDRPVRTQPAATVHDTVLDMLLVRVTDTLLDMARDRGS
jgi:hypothetical protein